MTRSTTFVARTILAVFVATQSNMLNFNLLVESVSKCSPHNFTCFTYDVVCNKISMFFYNEHWGIWHMLLLKAPWPWISVLNRLPGGGSTIAMALLDVSNPLMRLHPSYWHETCEHAGSCHEWCCCKVQCLADLRKPAAVFVKSTCKVLICRGPKKDHGVSIVNLASICRCARWRACVGALLQIAVCHDLQVYTKYSVSLVSLSEKHTHRLPPVFCMAIGICPWSCWDQQSTNPCHKQKTGARQELPL